MPKFNEFENEWFGFECPICHVEDDGCEHHACCVNWHTGGVAAVREYLLQALELLKGLSNANRRIESAPHLSTLIEALDEFTGTHWSRIPSEQLQEYLSDLPFAPYVDSVFGSLGNSVPFRCRTDHWGPGNAFLLTGWHSHTQEALIESALVTIEQEIVALPIDIGPLSRPTQSVKSVDDSAGMEEHW